LKQGKSNKEATFFKLKGKRKNKMEWKVLIVAFAVIVATAVSGQPSSN